MLVPPATTMHDKGGMPHADADVEQSEELIGGIEDYCGPLLRILGTHGRDEGRRPGALGAARGQAEAADGEEDDGEKRTTLPTMIHVEHKY